MISEQDLNYYMNGKIDKMAWTKAIAIFAVVVGMWFDLRVGIPFLGDGRITITEARAIPELISAIKILTVELKSLKDANIILSNRLMRLEDREINRLERSANRYDESRHRERENK